MISLHLYGFLLAPEEKDRARIVSPIKKSGTVPEKIATLPPVLQHATVSNFRMHAFAAHTLIPVRLAVVYPRGEFLKAAQPWMLPLMAVPVLFIGLLIWKPRWRPTLGFGLAWFAITVSPILASDGIGTNFVSDRYTYIPSLGLIWLVIPFLLVKANKQVAGKVTLGQALCAALILTMTVGTVNQVTKWKTSMSLWNQVIDNYPTNWYAYYNRGKLIAPTDPAQAISDFTRSIESQSDRGDTYYSRGTVYMNQGMFQDAVNDFTLAISHSREPERSLLNRGSSYRSLKMYDEALADFQSLSSMGVMKLKTANNLGLTYADLGRNQKALQQYNYVLGRKPDYVPALVNRGNLYLKPDMSRFGAARRDFEQATQLDPENHNAWFRFAYSLARLSRHQEAIEAFNKAIGLEPSQGFYYFGRAQSYEAIGSKSGALADYQQAKRLGVNVDPQLLSRNQ